MKISSPLLIVAILSGSFLHSFNLNAQTPPKHGGVGIVRQDHHAPSVRVAVNPASINGLGTKTYGDIVASLGLPPEHYKHLKPGASWVQWPTTYKATAKLYVYRISGLGYDDKLVYEGEMPSVTARIQIMPPSNALIEGEVETFATQLNTGSRSGLNLFESGNYRAEVVFYIQEFGMKSGLSVGWEPQRIEVAGGAVEFSIGGFALAPVSEVRGEVSVYVRVIPRKGATAQQVAELQSGASREGARAAGAIRTFLGKHSQKSPVGSAERQPWFYSESAKSGGVPYWNFFVPAGQTYSDQVAGVQAELKKLLTLGNVTRTLPGGTFSVVTTTNIKFHAR